MSKTTRIILGIIALIIIILLVRGFGNNSKVTSSETIKIGVLSPMTGPKGKIGEGARQAVLLAQSEMGEGGKKFEFVFEDSTGESSKGLAGAKKLANIDKVRAMLSLATTDGLMAGSVAEENKIVHIGIANDHNVSKGEYNFLHWTPLPEQVKLFTTELKKRNIQKISLFTENNDGTLATRDEIIKQLTAAGIEIVFDEKFNSDVTDFKSTLTKVKTIPSDAYVLNAFSPKMEIFQTQKKTMGITTPTTSVTAIATVKDVTPFEGDWYVSGGLAPQDFTAKFEKQAGFPPTIGAHYAYDSAHLLMKLFLENPTISSDELKNKIETMDYTNYVSVTGINGIDADGHFQSPGDVVLVKDGKHTKFYK
jgi:ABC-type branched-subunit amino acid transport system substrate-binding protein